MHNAWLYRQNKICLFCAVATRFFPEGHKKNKKRGRFGIFHNVKFLGHTREYIKYKVKGFP